MGTRSGAIDPGVVLHLLTERGMSVAEVTDVLYHRSGLLGVSGISNDMRTLLASTAREAAAWLGVRHDAAANRRGGPRISTTKSIFGSARTRPGSFAYPRPSPASHTS